MDSTDKLIRETEALLDRCGAAMLESYSFQVWREIERKKADAASVLNAIPSQEYGREEIDPDTWRA